MYRVPIFRGNLLNFAGYPVTMKIGYIGHTVWPENQINCFSRKCFFNNKEYCNQQSNPVPCLVIGHKKVILFCWISSMDSSSVSYRAGNQKQIPELGTPQFLLCDNGKVTRNTVERCIQKAKERGAQP